MGLNNDVFNTIEDIASDFSKKIKDKFPEINNLNYLLVKTVECLGGKVVGTNKPEYYEVNGGSLLVKKIGDFIIKLPMDTSPLSDNFTIAHELGHYFLHYKENDQIRLFARYGDGILEIEANRFAAALLMPKDEIIDAYHKFGGDLIKIAAKFQVPVDIVQKRLEYING